ncbi:MAG: endonuclease [Gammaproteobacteria bacterium]|nr:endonuclease [Gammaproteobacteria bacterium]MDH5691708.1 endonuclease [Gammaproteobacteria bacterium]
MVDDAEVERRYRKSSKESPSVQLDRLILDMAKHELGRRKYRATKRMGLFATAATLVLSIGLVTFMEREVPEEVVITAKGPAVLVEEPAEEKSEQSFDRMPAPLANADRALKKQQAPVSAEAEVATMDRAFGSEALSRELLAEAPDRASPPQSRAPSMARARAAVETGISAQALRRQLNSELVSTHKKVFRYNDVWQALEYTDEDPKNSKNVILLYSQRSTPKTAKHKGEEGDNLWNREHVWPKSHGFPKKNQSAYTDLHHLRPSDRHINSDRRDWDFDEGGKSYNRCQCKRKKVDKNSGSFEPPHQVKGDIARMLFYMDVRYEGEDESKTPDLVLSDRLTQAGDVSIGKLCVLLRWHRNDPPDSVEKRRNQRIKELQGNRNPFIDDPNLASQLWGRQCSQ